MDLWSWFFSRAAVDLLLGVGGVISVLVKLHGAWVEETTWPRRSSLFNVLAYPLTSLYPFFYLELYFTLGTSAANWLLWLFIYLFRPRDDEDLLGRQG